MTALVFLGVFHEQTEKGSLTDLFSQEKSDCSSKAASPAKRSPAKRSSAVASTPASSSTFSAASATAVASLYASVLGPAHRSGTRAAAPVEVDSSDSESSVVHLPTAEEKSNIPWFDPTRGCMVRNIPSKAGAVEEADMQPGDSGFLMATFPGEIEFETEIPNSMISLAKGAKPLASAVKAKAKAKAKGKAKAKTKAKAKAVVKAAAKAKAKAKGIAKGKAKSKAKAAAPASEFVFERYYYTKTGKCGIRQKLPERYQMFEFGNFSVTQQDLYEIADQCIARLLANDLAKEDAKEWCLQRFRNLEQ